MKPTDVTQFISDLDGGVFEEKTGHALSEVAGAVADHQREGTVTLTLKVKPLGTGGQVHIEHQLRYQRPTLHGKSSEEETTKTPMYVGPHGLTLFPDDPSQDMFAGEHRRKSTPETE